MRFGNKYQYNIGVKNLKCFVCYKMLVESDLRNLHMAPDKYIGMPSIRSKYVSVEHE